MNKKNDTPRAIVVSFNWRTKEILFTDFEGEDAALDAQGWADKRSFLWRDFPEKDGWEHFPHWNKAAGEIKGAKFVAALKGEGEHVVKIPQ